MNSKISESNRALFICSTPYQVMNAVCLKNAHLQGYKCDMVLMDYFEDAHNLMKRIERTNIFDTVFLAWDKTRYEKYYQKSFFGRNLFQITTLLDAKKLLQNLGINANAYTKLFVSYNEPLACLIIKEASQEKQLKVYAFEDGTATYTLDDFGTSFGKIERLFGVNEDSFTRTGYVHKPELCINPENAVAIGSIATLETTKKELNRLFKTNNMIEKPIDVDYLFLDGLDDECFIKSIIAELQATSMKSIMIKPHPRRPRSFYDSLGLECALGPSDSMEILYLNGLIDESTILVSSCSTASFTPKLLFDFEPKVFFLYKLDPNPSRIKGNALNLIYKFKETYTEQDKIVIPASISSFHNKLLH